MNPVKPRINPDPGSTKTQFNPEYAEREVLKPDWCVPAIEGVQKSCMQTWKWTCDRMGISTPVNRKRKIFILEMPLALTNSYSVIDVTYFCTFYNPETPCSGATSQAATPSAGQC